MQTFLLLGLDALLCTAEVKPGQKRVRFQCEQDPTLRLEWDFAPPPDFRSGRCAPADLRKDAGAFDLPIALGMLVATGQLLPEQLRDFATMGELALDGSVRPIKGALSMAMAAASKSIPKLLVPAANAREAAVVEAVQVFGVNSLADAVGILAGQLPAEPVAPRIEELFARLNTYDVDFGDVRGQEFAKRALVVAAAGAHNVLMM